MVGLKVYSTLEFSSLVIYNNQHVFEIYSAIDMVKMFFLL